MHRLAVALTTLLGLTAATYLAGYLFLFSGSTDRAAGLAPASTAAYVTVYLEPSAGQQMNLVGLIGRLPGFADEASIDQKIDEVAQNLLANTGIDYRTDLKPWLGDQVSAAAWFTDDSAAVQQAVLIFAARDPAAAQSALEAFVERGGGTVDQESHRDVAVHVGPTVAWALVDEWIVLSATADAVRVVVDTSIDGEDLAARDDFSAAMDGLPSDHLAAAFLDLAALGEGTGATGAPADLTTAAAALVAEADGLRLSGNLALPTDQPSGSPMATAAPDAQTDSLAVWMPEETVAEVVISGLGGLLIEAQSAASGVPEGQQLVDAIDTLRVAAALGFGISLDQDILPLFDREAALALSGVQDGMPRGQLLLRPDDVGAAMATLEEIATGLVDNAGATRETETVAGAEIVTLSVPQLGELAFTSVEDVVILGLTADDVAAAVEAHADGSSLGAGGAYDRAFALAGEGAPNEAYADPDALLELLGVAQTLPDDARAILARLGAFGMTAEPRSDHIEFHAVLTIGEAAE